MFQLSYFQTGLIESVWFIGYLLASIPAAKLIERIGYQRAAEIAKAAHAAGTTLREEATRLGYVSAAEFDRLVRPEKMTRPG